jgi:hypothetical protein
MKKLLCGLMTLAAASCSAIRPYEKEFLLSPVMDEAEAGRLQPDFAKSNCNTYEKLASGAASSGGTSCPTCGG